MGYAHHLAPSSSHSYSQSIWVHTSFHYSKTFSLLEARNNTVNSGIPTPNYRPPQAATLKECG